AAPSARAARRRSTASTCCCRRDFPSRWSTPPRAATCSTPRSCARSSTGARSATRCASRTPPPRSSAATSAAAAAPPAPKSTPCFSGFTFLLSSPAVSNSPLTIAVVGAGGWGRNLVRVFSQLDGCRLAAVCDLDEQVLAEQRRQHPHVRCTAELASVLDDKSIAAVVVAVDAPRHHAV